MLNIAGLGFFKIISRFNRTNVGENLYLCTLEVCKLFAPGTDAGITAPAEPQRCKRFCLKSKLLANGMNGIKLKTYIYLI